MKLLDLFCGAGGCSVGYERAGFTHIVGVDVDANALRRYPYNAVRMDAMTALTGGLELDAFDAIHASPPCQAYSAGTRAADRTKHADLLLPTLDALRRWHERTGRPYVVENVPGAPFPATEWVVELCGAHRRAHDPLSGRILRLRRHRLFAVSHPILVQPCACDNTPIGGVYGAGASTPEAAKVRAGGYTPSIHVQRALMGTPWMTGKQTQQAIPPDYTEHIGRLLLETITA